ncbi:hypothetical protein KC332_g406 [Hortaea werneckii]|uniref:RTA1 domain protein n=2 Tax=Hortaea werneckii TaxID=91943 RepID=A0A3M7IZH3_HORWE|nr:hypothetical protein KC358_g475 [Hortaea werneckii]OTA25805.1 hypothetical protein BTJ68_10273 [Hortaea werneckii EXF-2000]KAI6852448.1 hypothetical protein KC350_g863 [Hortaea werneckii]KAI6944734.1 hypothetical protein KC341_g623 [Hortaea werneckii]KAI6950768.1 hypothetical protein KC348_g465 [Hortaea werneckii]
MADNNDWSLYPYKPSKAAPILFAILLALLGITQIYQSFFKYHWKKFGFMMVWATTCWVAGFVCRAISVYNTQSVNIFIAQAVFVYVGPPLYAAAEYFILGRLFAYLPYHTPIHPGRVVSTFMLLSAVVESLTANGAANMSAASDPSDDADLDKVRSQMQSGLQTMQAALLLQIAVEAMYLSLVILLERRCRRAQAFPKQIQPVFLVLYITSSMVIVRCIVRAIEAFEMADCPYGDQQCGYVTSHEWVFYVFECANITLFVVLLAVFHPGRYLPRSSRIFLDPLDGKTERVGPGFGKADSRNWLATVVDPFNLTAIVTGKGMRYNRFWESHQPIYTGGKVEDEEQLIPENELTNMKQDQGVALEKGAAT